MTHEDDATRWQDQPFDDGEQSLALIADWGPAEDWSDWADGRRALPRPHGCAPLVPAGGLDVTEILTGCVPGGGGADRVRRDVEVAIGGEVA